MRTFILALAIGLAACSGREQLTLNTHAELSITRETGVRDTLVMEGRLYDTELPREEFERAWSSVTRGTAPFDALAVTMTSVSITPGAVEPDSVPLLAGLVIAIPTPLRAGARYEIGAAFPPPFDGMPLYWRHWGSYELEQTDSAEISLRTFDYHTYGMVIENEFVATDVSGVIEVIRARDDVVQMRIDIIATDDAGQQVRLTGTLEIRAERYTPPIT